MAGDRRAGGAERAARVNAAADLLDAGAAAAEAARVLAGRLGCSARQARRYVDRAGAAGRVPVPEPGVVFTVKLPGRRARTARPGQEGRAHDERGDLRPGLQRPAEEGPDDRVADRGAARARRDQPA